MTMKPIRIVKGTLIRPLSVGECAMLLESGRYIRTSEVAAIHSVTARRICFETQNTRYYLLGPAPAAAASAPMSVGAAA